ncbi:unnamed protein product [Linum tenue]|uniref:RNase H type-1 domain-containing protein n=1 Tax=Linum tenue TaxID=586396 RepID=A0AAV0H0W5_9ROSI|nr:unnamed protein product [Linum tenue]
MAWEKGYRKVLLQLDSTTAINILSSHDHTEHRYRNLVLQFQGLIQRNWEVRISHIYREGNKVADFLANTGHSVSIGYHVFESSDSGLTYWILYDVLGISQTRLI